MKFDNVDQLIKDINSKDQEIIYNIRKKELIIIEERFKNWNKSSWEDFVRIVKSDKDNCNEESPDFTPIKMLCKFIENDGDHLVYLKAISLSYPKHPFCQMLIECETVTQLLNKLNPLESKFPILFHNDSVKWLSTLLEVKNL